MTAPKLSEKIRLHSDAPFIAKARLNIVFMAHPDFCGHVSMPRFHSMLLEGMRKRGHRVQTLTPAPRFFSLPFPKAMKKWLGYIDQYILFPREVKRQLELLPSNTLFVFTDNALGPWVPLAAHMPHVIHCHDFMAQQAALGELSDLKLSWTGRRYQKMIRAGYSKGMNFISGSGNTRRTLLKFLPAPPKVCALVYNGLHTRFQRHPTEPSRVEVSRLFNLDLHGGYLLHVGGNQWYKNRLGVIEIYNAWRGVTSTRLPLLLIGQSPSPELRAAYEASSYKNDIHFITNADDNAVNLLYSAATVFLFPSKAEGFGWPIAEAMSAGCPVITTDEAPMTEVAGNAGFLIPKYPEQGPSCAWAWQAGLLVEKIVGFSNTEREAAIRAGIANAKRFDTDKALDRIERVYKEIVDAHTVNVE